MQNKFEIAKVSPTHALHLPRILCFSIISLFLLSWNALFISRPTVRCSEAHCVCSNLRNLKYKGRTGRERKSEGSEEKVGREEKGKIRVVQGGSGMERREGQKWIGSKSSEIWEVCEREKEIEEVSE